MRQKCGILKKKEGADMDFSKYGIKRASSCESCAYYDYDEYTDSYSCQVNLDEDEMQGFLSGSVRGCPYYKFYDEYKSVQRQI